MYNGDPENDLMVQYMNQRTMNLQTLIEWTERAKRTCYMNHKSPSEIPFIVNDGRNFRYKVPWYGIGLSWGKGGMVASLEFDGEERIMPIIKDVRPVDKKAEYWMSRGPSFYDVSGFVRSKEAGERLLRMVKYILEKDDVETYLDWRETEPEWIQFKFSANEFDVERLSELAQKNGNIITEDIIRECVK